MGLRRGGTRCHTPALRHEGVLRDGLASLMTWHPLVRDPAPARKAGKQQASVSCRSSHDDHGHPRLAAGTLGISHLVRVPGAPAGRARRPAPREGPRSPLGGRRGGGTALLATYSAARPGSPDTGWIAAAASRSAAARIAAIWLLACCRTTAAARSAASCMALTSAHAHCVVLAAWPSARLRMRHACQSESVSRNRPGCCGYPACCG